MRGEALEVFGCLLSCAHAGVAQSATGAVTVALRALGQDLIELLAYRIFVICGDDVDLAKTYGSAKFSEGSKFSR